MEQRKKQELRVGDLGLSRGSAHHQLWGAGLGRSVSWDRNREPPGDVDLQGRAAVRSASWKQGKGLALFCCSAV